jgi:DNA polymerase III delta subunit
MKLHELQKQIVSKKLDKVYVFTGEEIGVMDIYLDKIYSIVGCDVVRMESVQEAYAKMTQRRISGAPRCFVVRDDKEFLKQDKIWNTVFTLADKSPDYLILIYSSIDKRSKFYKQNTEKLTEFEKLSPELLAKYISKELPGIKERDAYKLAEICECNYSRILLECDKIRHYAHRTQKSNGVVDFGKAMNILIEQGVIFQPIGDITFKFTDAILTRDYKNTSRYLREARQKGESEVMILSILYNGFKQILMVQGLGRDQRDAVRRTGLTPWQVKMAQKKQGHYSISELIKALKIIRFVEMGIKTGQIDADVSLEYVIVNIM